MPDHRRHSYRGLISSDWNECLAPCGPFDAIAYHYPRLEKRLSAVFRAYTANKISLAEATRQVGVLLPQPLTPQQMDAYLQSAFAAYPGVVELMAWSSEQDICFMLNTTGAIGFFQRAFAKGLVPTIPVLSAHPMIRFAASRTDPPWILELSEISDKAGHTEQVARLLGIPITKIVLMGDSGGDGPHFRWGAARGARLLGCMTKPSLEEYCRRSRIKIDYRFGPSHREGHARDRRAGARVDFMQLSPLIKKWLF
jgi:hypothetical protein